MSNSFWIFQFGFQFFFFFKERKIFSLIKYYTLIHEDDESNPGNDIKKH